MNVREFEIAKLHLKAKTHGEILNVIKSFGTYGCILGCMYLMFDGLKTISSANPDGINAIALVVKNLNFSSIVSYIVAAGCATGWAAERRGKKRLVAAQSKNRKTIEAADSYHEGSGLTETGDTPPSIAE